MCWQLPLKALWYFCYIKRATAALTHLNFVENIRYPPDKLAFLNPSYIREMTCFTSFDQRKNITTHPSIGGDLGTILALFPELCRQSDGVSVIHGSLKRAKNVHVVFQSLFGCTISRLRNKRGWDLEIIFAGEAESSYRWFTHMAFVLEILNESSELECNYQATRMIALLDAYANARVLMPVG